MPEPASTTALPAANATKGTRTAPAPTRMYSSTRAASSPDLPPHTPQLPEPVRPCTATATAHPWQPVSRQAAASSGEPDKLTCNGCHGNPPAYANNTPKTNSHANHNFGCGTCHAGTTTDGITIADKSLHVNGAYNVTPGAGATFTYTYAATGGTCSNISCHGNTSATWGSTLRLRHLPRQSASG